MRKDDPMYYTETIKKLIKTATENNINVYVKDVMGGTRLYFEAVNIHECWSVELPKQ